MGAYGTKKDEAKALMTLRAGETPPPTPGGYWLSLVTPKFSACGGLLMTLKITKNLAYDTKVWGHPPTPRGVPVKLSKDLDGTSASQNLSVITPMGDLGGF